MKIQEIPYIPNSANLFDHFNQLPYAIFLDSCSPYHNQGRYDIITADPETVITIDRDDAIKNPFHIISIEMQKLKKHASSIQHSLPFTIGALGYLSYDVVRQLEKIPNVALDDITLPQAVIGIYHWSIVVDHEKQKTYYITIYDDAYHKKKYIDKLLNQCNEITNFSTEFFTLTEPFVSNLTKNNYKQKFNIIKKHIINGDCYQINFAQRFSAKFKGSPWCAYKQLRKINPAPFAVFMQFHHAAILSVSPERFLKVCNQRVITTPIKGTISRFKNPIWDQQAAAKLLSSEKDRAENVMIVDLLRNDLSRVCEPGSIRVPTLFALESFSSVHHLVSTITGKLSSNKNAIDVFQYCFPGGSITGAPKIRAMEIIESLEPHRRSVYCGSIFYLDICNNFDSNIVIRTLICDHNRIHCYGGGGIVYDSTCEKEYEETISKIKKMLKITPTARH